MAWLTSILTALFPTSESNEPLHLFRWRQTVALYNLVLGGIVVFAILVAWGRLTFIGLTGFATTLTVQDLQSVTVGIRLSQIERSIRESKSDLCIAQYSGDMQVIRLAGNALRDAQNEYYNFTMKFSPPARFYPEPTCDVLIVTKR